MKPHLKIRLLIFGTLGLLLTINSGYAGRRLAANLSSRSAAGASNRQWVWQNPLPQGNTLQDFSFVDPANGFAVGTRGTILKTTDAGQNWELITGQAEDDLYGVSFIDSNTGTIVGNFGAILRTTDAGSHWTIQRDDALSSSRARARREVAEEGISATGDVPNPLHTVLLNRLDCGSPRW